MNKDLFEFLLSASVLICVGGIFLSLHQKVKIETAKTISVSHEQWGTVTKVGPCSSGKYSYTCRVYTQKMELIVDLDDLPYNIVNVGDKIFVEERVTEMLYTKILCQNSMCTSAVTYEYCVKGDDCYENAYNRIVKGIQK